MPDPASATEAMPFAVLLDQYDATRNRLGYYEREINRTGGEPIVVERAEVARRRLDMARSRILEAVQQAHAAGVRLREKNHAMAGELDKAKSEADALRLDITRREMAHAETIRQMMQDHLGRVAQAHAAGVAEGIERAAKRIEEIADEDRYMSRHLMGQLAGEIRALGRDQEGKTP